MVNTVILVFDSTHINEVFLIIRNISYVFSKGKNKQNEKIKLQTTENPLSSVSAMLLD